MKFIPPKIKPHPVKVLDDGESEQIEKNLNAFKDPLEGVKDAKIRRMQMSEIQLLFMIFERLGQMGRVLEQIRDKK